MGVYHSGVYLPDFKLTFVYFILLNVNTNISYSFF